MSLRKFFINKISGKLATEFTPPETKIEKVITNVHTILYWIDRSNITGPPPTDPSANSQYSHWDIPVQNWWSQNMGKYPIITQAQKPIAVDDVHTEMSQSSVSIIEPNEDTTYPTDQKIQVKITNLGSFPLQKIDIYINDVYVGSSNYPFYFSFIPSDLDNLQDLNTIKIVSYDTVYNRGETTSTFKVEQ